MQKDLRNTIVAIVLIVIASIIAGYIDYDKSNDLAAKIAENDDLQTQIDNLTKEKGEAKLKALQDQLKVLNDNFSNYVKILPSAEIATPERLRKTVQSWCEAAALDWDDMAVADDKKVPQSQKLGEFQKTTISLRATGSFETFVKFLNNIERHEQFFRVESYSLAPKGAPRFLEGGKQQLDLNLNVVIATFTYVPQK